LNIVEAHIGFIIYDNGRLTCVKLLRFRTYLCNNMQVLQDWFFSFLMGQNIESYLNMRVIQKFKSWRRNY